MLRQPLLGLLMAGTLWGLATPSLAQQVPVPARGSNRVWVATTTAPDTVLLRLQQHLQAQGFVIDTLDQLRGVLTTKVVLPATSRAGEMKIRAAKTGPDWKLTGTYVIAAYGSGVAYPAEFLGAEMMPAKSAFRLVEEAARSIPHGTLRYDKAKVRFSAFTSLADALQSVW
jgi:hypothetical protein